MKARFHKFNAAGVNLTLRIELHTCNVCCAEKITVRYWFFNNLHISDGCCLSPSRNASGVLPTVVIAFARNTFCLLRWWSDWSGLESVGCFKLFNPKFWVLCWEITVQSAGVCFQNLWVEKRTSILKSVKSDQKLWLFHKYVNILYERS